MNFLNRIRNNLTGKRMKRGLSVFFAFLTVLSVFVISPMNADAGTDKVKVYHWKLASTRTDVRNGPVILTWTTNNVTYFTGAGLTGLNAGDYPAFDFSASDFYTMTDVPCWRMERSGSTDGNNDNAPLVRLYNADGCCMYYDGGFKTAGTSGTASLPGRTWFTVGTHGSKKYDEDTRQNCLRFIFNVSGSDPQLVYHGSKLSTESSVTYTKADNFRVYIADEEEFSAIDKNLTVESGSVFQIKGDTVLTEGTTITVKPGGILSVEGTFYNHGYIRTEGSFVIQENALVTALDPEATGSFFFRGGERDSEGSLIVMKGALFAVSESSMIQFTDADVVCRGVMVVPYGFVMKNTVLNRQGSGAVLLGYGFKNGTAASRRLAEDMLSPNADVRKNAVQEHLRVVSAATVSVYGTCAFLNCEEDACFFSSFVIPYGQTTNGVLLRSYDEAR